MVSPWSTIFGNLFVAVLLALCGCRATSIYPLSESTNKVCGYGSYNVYLTQTGKCYQNGSRGPCEELMEVTETDEAFGIGKCECQPSKCGSRPTIYWPEKNRCYYIFDQGPCPEGQWIVPQTEGVPKCENIPCPEKYNPPIKPTEFYYVFPYKNDCYITHTDNVDTCPEGEQAQFLSPKLPHVCSKPILCKESGTGAGLNRCSNGEKPDNYGGCEPQTELH